MSDDDDMLKSDQTNNQETLFGRGLQQLKAYAIFCLRFTNEVVEPFVVCNRYDDIIVMA